MPHKELLLIRNIFLSRVVKVDRASDKRGTDALKFCRNPLYKTRKKDIDKKFRITKQHRNNQLVTTSPNMSIGEGQEPLLERLSATPEPKPSSKNTPKDSKKRKREADLPEAKKTAKKPKNKKTKEVENDELDLELCINRTFSHMDNRLLADYIAQRTRRYESDLSSIELEDRFLPGVYCCTNPKSFN